jgi:hypothetical protein
MSLAVWQQTIVDANGEPVAGASVRVMNADTDALVTIKPNRDGSGTLGNPFSADADGFARFYVAQGRYKVRVTYAGSDRELVHVVLWAEALADVSTPGYLLDTPAAGVTHDYTPASWPGAPFPARLFLEIQPGAGAASIGSLPSVDDDGNAIPNGAEIILTCKHANGLTLLAEDASATAAGRIEAAFDLGLADKMSCRLIRSTTISRWKLLP